MPIRLITTFVLIVGAFIAPWWAVVGGIVLCTFTYRHFFEALIPAVSIDVLYGAHTIGGVPAGITLLTIVLIVCSLFADTYLRHVRI